MSQISPETGYLPNKNKKFMLKTMLFFSIIDLSMLTTQKIQSEKTLYPWRHCLLDIEEKPRKYIRKNMYFKKQTLYKHTPKWLFRNRQKI